MAERSAVNQVCQLGAETTPGTVVPATFTFASLKSKHKPEFDIAAGRSAGNKYNTTSVVNKVWASGDFSGAALFTEVPIVMAGLVGVTFGAQIGTTGAYPWTATPATSGEDSGRTFFTGRIGDATAAELMAYLAFKNFEMNFGDATQLKAGFFARSISQGGALTPSVAQLANVPISRKHWNIYIDTSAGALGTTQFAKSFSGALKLGDFLTPVFFLDRAQASFGGVAEQEVEGTFELIVAHDSASRALYNAITTDILPKRFIRVEAVGPNIGSGADYKAVVDMCVAFRGAEPMVDGEQKVYAYKFMFGIQHDDDWGQAWEASGVTKMSEI